MTITEIAAACGVAPSTASRALSNPNRVSAEMYERISRKATEMGYASAMLPVTPKGRARGTIALVLPNLTNPYNLDLIRGSHAQARAADYLHVLVSSDESVHAEGVWLRELARTVDGIVISSPRCDDAVLQAAADTVPIVVVNRDVPGLSGVVVDTAAGMAQALDYLVSLGHRSIAYVRGPVGSWTDRARFAALTEAAERHGVELIAVGAYLPTLSAGAAASDAVVLTGATSAIFFNDTLAVGALARFRQLGVDVPEQLSVVGCDDIFGASFSNPPLTTVTSPGERAGHDATDLLMSRFSSRDRSRRLDRLAAHLSVRESTGPAPGSR
ncbi:LacI family DNA-binding transcriptional regulator [Tsukamurella soli]|uniref:LacI family DNA-binding transcriptional regulator n=1 Tax=Tsukamurella soli TaxID=644556 RepID=A0ABP8JHI3_9ACTN